jgi:hypothetical protein
MAAFGAYPLTGSMAALDATEEIVNAFWKKEHGEIDNNDEDYNKLKSWAFRKAFNSKKPVTDEMLQAYVNSDFAVTPKSVPPKSPGKAVAQAIKKTLGVDVDVNVSGAETSTWTKKDKELAIKESMIHVYKLFGKKDGRGKVDAKRQPLYTALSSWVNHQVWGC